MSIHDLRNLIVGRREVPGRIIKTDGTMATVATDRGVKQVLAPNLEAGDPVSVVDSMATKRTRGSGQIYNV